MTVRPWLAGKERRPIKAPSALLLLFLQAGSATSAGIPLAQAQAEADGHFNLPDLGSGDYLLKLYSAKASRTAVSASLVAGSPADVTFSTGPSVRGRVTRNSGGNPNEPVVVELGLELFGAAVAKVDSVEHFQTTAADENGNFLLTVSVPGNYVVRAHWGSASAVRTVTVSDTMADVDIGEIALANGVALRGFLPSCGSGEAVMIPVPSPTKPIDIGSPTHRAHIDGAGRFIVEGLTAGEWSVLARCNAALVDLTPSVVLIRESGDTVAEFTTAPP